MFWNSKKDQNPFGVPLGDLVLLLNPTSIVAYQEKNTVIAKHEHYVTRIEVNPPDDMESDNVPIQAVVRVKTQLPAQIEAFVDAPEMIAAFNPLAALSGLVHEDGRVYIGSRLTIYKGEHAWRDLHLPLLLFTTICGADAILGAIRRTITNESEPGGASSWTEDDIEQVHSYLSKLCACTTGGRRFTAEFGLVEGAVSRILGDHSTALFQLMADQPHPELGGGLFCLLQMPHRLRDDKALRQVCLRLNQVEMEARDLPPHFGAWCEGKMGNNPAYVSFLPNPLHTVDGIAVNMAIWALNRARWANATLASLGVSA